MGFIGSGSALTCNKSTERIEIWNRGLGNLIGGRVMGKEEEEKRWREKEAKEKNPFSLVPHVCDAPISRRGRKYYRTGDK